mmetsp:Transcript_46488/g.137378  ORF Transcript_46488/g.137378 Transcript_46488/m.137378 type:complete len:542 (+) Transcript_46488:97-1722(+)
MLMAASAYGTQRHAGRARRISQGRNRLPRRGCGLSRVAGAAPGHFLAAAHVAGQIFCSHLPTVAASQDLLGRALHAHATAMDHDVWPLLHLRRLAELAGEAAVVMGQRVELLAVAHLLEGLAPWQREGRRLHGRAVILAGFLRRVGLRLVLLHLRNRSLLGGVLGDADADPPALRVEHRVVLPEEALAEDPHPPEVRRQLDGLEGRRAALRGAVHVVLGLHDHVERGPSGGVEAEREVRELRKVAAGRVHPDRLHQHGDLEGRAHQQGGAGVHGHLAPRIVREGIVAELERLPVHEHVPHGHQPVPLVRGLVLVDGQPVHVLTGGEAVASPVAEGDLAVLVGVQRAQEHRDDGVDGGGIGLQAVHEVEVRARGQALQAKAEDPVEGELHEGEPRLLNDPEEVGRGAHLLAGDSIAEADVVADVLPGELAGAVRDARRVAVPLARERGIVLVRQLLARLRSRAQIAVVSRANLLLALHRRQHDVARPRVEDDVEELRRASYGDLAVVLRDMHLAADPARRRRGISRHRHRHLDDADIFLQRQ